MRLFVTIPIFFVLLARRAFLLKYGEILNHIGYTANATFHELSKRGLHEDNPLLYQAENHLLEYYLLPPHYPSRMSIFVLCILQPLQRLV